MSKARRSVRSGRNCRSLVNRRNFLKVVGLGAATFAHGIPSPAETSKAPNFDAIIPQNKKLSPEWIRSLFARGAQTVYRGAELEKIGMPIGGICTGQVYLGGDGRLWHWDIFNQLINSGCEGPHYAKPPSPEFPLEQGFSLRVNADGKNQIRAIDRRGFTDIAFQGQYPIGQIEYRDPGCPVSVSLEAFSPFIPLNPEDSHLPATILRFTVKNDSNKPIECELAGWLENAVCLHSAQPNLEKRVNTIVRRPGMTLLDCTAVALPRAECEPDRPPVVFADFEADTFEKWTVEGDAFGRAPARGAPNPVQKLSAFTGKGLANSWPGSDEPKGKLISPPFTIERPYIRFLIGGGNHPDGTCINLVVGGRRVRTATGRDSDAMTWTDWAVHDLVGKTAQLEIVDRHSESWGHVEIDQIEFADKPRIAPGPLQTRPDFGSMCLALLDAEPADLADAAVPIDALPQCPFNADSATDSSATIGGSPNRLVGALARRLTLDPAAQKTVTFVVAWHFPNIQHIYLKNINGRKYGKRFASAADVTRFIAANFDRLASQTRLWRDTWYDSTLPHWFLDRTFQNISTLATSTAYWFANDRFYGWEGVGSCEGTCTHVWQYAQAVARIFPSLERTTREMVDFGSSFHADTGAMDYRGEYGPTVAVDGQAGTILRAYREHQMAPDNAFLQRNWPKIKKALQFLIERDIDKNGILDGPQYNTLDTAWFGQIAWISSLYVAALRAGEQMAQEMGDDAFARQTRSIAEAGTKNIDEKLFNGEYYIQVVEKKHPNEEGSYDGCEIDQVLGQSWAHQVGLGRILPREHTLAALQSLWKYNFTPDVGPYRKANPSGRWYAMPGEGGLLMCTWPRGDAKRVRKGFDPYFNECMSGFEYQVAGHMIWEGMVQEGLAITRTVHDRYHASRRNPWNEVECGDHYSRAMASYGVFLAACGYRYHGPKGCLAFAPRLSPDNFRAAFTTAEGWGAFSQKRDGNRQCETLEVKHGKLRLCSLAFDLAADASPGTVTVEVNGTPLPSTHQRQANTIVIAFADTTLNAPDKMEIVIQ